MIYNRLLSLYKRNRNSYKTPLEDFTTEIFVGILENDEDLLNTYVNKILKIEGNNYTIDSQVKYSVYGDKNCIIDMVVKNEHYICFIENKVNSVEGDRQLERYSNLLKTIEENECKKVYLRYCTKLYDKKDIVDIDFLQYRWSDIYSFLQENIDDNDLIEEYLEFLEGEGMSSAGEFEYQDLIVMTKINSTIAKMDECLDSIKDTLINSFDNINDRYYERVKDIVKTESYKIGVNNIIGDGDSRIDVGFTFENDLETVAPFLSVDLIVYSNNTKFKDIMKKKNKLDTLFDSDYSDDDRILLSFEKPLCEFISNNNQINCICDWFNEKIHIVKDIVDSM